MAKDIYEENKELSRTLYIIEKAILDFRLKQLDLPLERVNCPSVFSPNVAPVPYTVTTTCGECDKEKEDLRQQIAELTNKLNTANEELDTFKKKDCERKVEEAEEIFPSDVDEYPLPVEKEEPAPAPPIEEEKKVRKPRKERGGTVFTDFKTLDLDNNNFDGNSIVYSKKDM